MKYIVRITDHGPLSFRAGRETSSGQTLTYVSGSVLLGALASTYAKLRHDDATSFKELFFSDESSFGNLYPSSFSHDGLARDSDAVYPLPKTASSCKRFGGFRFDEDDPDDDPHHGVYDTLLPWALFALSQESNFEVFKNIEECADCGEGMDRIDGFYRRNARDAKKMGTASPKRSLRTRTGINRATGTVQQGILYNREVLRPGTEFWGTVTIPDAQAKTFKKFVEEASESGLLRLGNNKTRGFGRVSLRLKPARERGELDSLRQRITEFDKRLREAANFKINTPHKLYLPFTLTSDAILFDHLLRYRSAIDGQYLETLGISGAKLIYQNSGTRQVMGWNTLLRVPKADDIAITMGSVFLFGLESELDDNLLQTLLRMQSEGIGARRGEGFGRLLLASRFHWEVKGS
jgi:CRISPR-associated Csx10 family RAMP protein